MAGEKFHGLAVFVAVAGQRSFARAAELGIVVGATYFAKYPPPLSPAARFRVTTITPRSPATGAPYLAR
jgi:hypothetical protein